MSLKILSLKIWGTYLGTGVIKYFDEAKVIGCGNERTVAVSVRAIDVST